MTGIYLLSMLANAYNIIINHGVGSTGHGREVVDGLDATDKKCLSMLMKNVQLPGASDYDSQMEIYTSTTNTNITLEMEFQKYLSDPTKAHGLLGHGNDR